MNAQSNVDADFLAKAAEGRNVHLEKLMGILEEYLGDVFADDRELLLEDMKEWISRLQTDTELMIGEIHTYEELRSPAASWKIASLVNERIDRCLYSFGEKKKTCVNMAARLLLGAGAAFEAAEEKMDQVDFRITELPALAPADEEKLEALRKERAALSEEIERIEKEKEEAENDFREMVRQNAEVRSRMEAERPEIQYLTRKVRREGFFGFLIDLVGKPKTETVTDDSELVKWQERVDEVQREYDARARESNERIEALKESWREKEEAFDHLDTAQRELEKRFREQLKVALLEELEEYLHGEGGFADRVAAGMERDLSLNAEKIRDRIWEIYRKRI